MDKNEEKKYYIPVGKEKVYVQKKIFDEFNWLRRRQAYANNRYRSHTEPIAEHEELVARSDVGEEAIQNILIQQVLSAFQELTAEEKLLIRLIYLEDKTEREAAAYLNIAQTTFHYKKRRVLQKLKEKIE